MNTQLQPMNRGTAPIPAGASMATSIAVCGLEGSRPTTLFALLVKCCDQDPKDLEIYSNSAQFRRSVGAANEELDARRWPAEPAGPSTALEAVCTTAHNRDPVPCEFRVGVMSGSHAEGGMAAWLPVLEGSGVIVLQIDLDRLADDPAALRTEAIASAEEILRMALKQQSPVVVAYSASLSPSRDGSDRTIPTALARTAKSVANWAKRLQKAGLLCFVPVVAPTTASEMNADGVLTRVPSTPIKAEGLEALASALGSALDGAVARHQSTTRKESIMNNVQSATRLAKRFAVGALVCVGVVVVYLAWPPRSPGPCPECEGSGSTWAWNCPGKSIPCTRCDGTGHVVQGSCPRCVNGVIPGCILDSDCEECGGTGNNRK